MGVPGQKYRPDRATGGSPSRIALAFLWANHMLCTFKNHGLAGTGHCIAVRLGGVGGIARLPPLHGHLCCSTSVGRFAAPSRPVAVMADVATTAPRKRTFRKFSYRGVDLDALLDLSSEQLMELVPARVRRKFSRGLNRKSMALIKKLRKAKKECPEFEKPAPVKTHLRNMIIVPEMIGSVVGVYNGKVFNQVEIKPDMVSHYLGGKVFHHLQACAARQARYWCHPLFPLHPPQVEKREPCLYGPARCGAPLVGVEVKSCFPPAQCCSVTGLTCPPSGQFCDGGPQRPHLCVHVCIIGRHGISVVWFHMCIGLGSLERSVSAVETSAVRCLGLFAVSWTQALSASLHACSLIPACLGS
eukprot:contig_806_g77